MGFQKNKYFDGTEFERKSDYAPRMKAMELSHSWWVQYQEISISDMKMKEYQNLMKRYKNCDNVLLNARACAREVIAKMRKEGKENCDVSQADMQHFASSICTISKLKDFVKQYSVFQHIWKVPKQTK